MGKQSRLKNLRLDLAERIRQAKAIVSTPYEQGKMTGRAIKAYRKLKPLMAHVDDDKCTYCTPLFLKIKECPDILALPGGSFKEANEHILKHEPCGRALQMILNCPVYKEKNKL